MPLKYFVSVYNEGSMLVLRSPNMFSLSVFLINCLSTCHSSSNISSLFEFVQWHTNSSIYTMSFRLLCICCSIKLQLS